MCKFDEFIFSQKVQLTCEKALSWASTKGVSSKKMYKSYAKKSYTKGVTFENKFKQFHEQV